MSQKRSPKLGFLVTHGTDTMSWGLSAIRYILKNLPTNVAITGSQVPLSFQFSSSDVYPNVENSIKLLTQLTGPEIFVVFNNGKAAFQDALWKYDKWSPDAFSGEELATISLDEIIIRGRAYPLNLNRKLDKLYLIRTGGTIDAESNEDGLLLPTGNLISSYITQRFQSFYSEFLPISLMAKDSSDLILDSWIAISKKIAEECQKSGYTTFCDLSINTNVQIVSTSPYMSESDYDTAFKNADGIILTAYGSGTVNCDRSSGYSPMPAIERAIKAGKIIVIASQTPFGTQDFIYQNAWEPIEKGAIPAGDFSIAHSQIKLSYILGHMKIIEKIAKAQNIPAQILVKLSFLSGIDFRSNASRKKFEKLIGYQIPIKDPFFNVPFETALNKIIRFLNRKETKQICIDSLEKFEEMYSSYFYDKNKRSKWAIILKPDTVIGANQWGELVDASNNMATITSELLDWNIVILELSEIPYEKLLLKISELTKDEEIGEFLRSFRYVIIEGGRQSLYDAKSFDDISNGYFTKDNYLDLLQSLVYSRNEPGTNPGLFICLGHQGIAEMLRHIIIRLVDSTENVTTKLDTINPKASQKFASLMVKINKAGNIKIKRLNNEIVARNYRDQYFAVKKNEMPEVGLKKLSKYQPKKDEISNEIYAAYTKVAKFHSGILEDFYSLETLDIVMLHNDEVNEEAILYINWVLSELAKFTREYYKDLAKDNELKHLLQLPIGIEIPSSTEYHLEDVSGKILTEIAGMVIYYYNPETSILKRDYTLQFHPELFEEIQIMQKRDFESKTLLDLSDGIQLLLSCLQAGFIESSQKF